MKVKAAEGVLGLMGAASMAGNVVATWGHPMEMVIGAAFPVLIALAEWLAHDPRAQGWQVRAGILFATAAAIVWSFSHLASLVDGTWMRWLIPCAIDVLFIIAMQMVLTGNREKPAPEPQVIEKIVEVEVQVPVYIERPVAASEVTVHAEVEETETVTETRSVTRTRRAGMTAEQHGQVLELIALKREEIAAGTRGVAAEIMGKVGLTGHPNQVTRLPEWKAIKA